MSIKFHEFIVRARYPKLLDDPHLLDEFPDKLWMVFRRYLYEDEIEDIRVYPSDLELEDYHQIRIMGIKLGLPRMAWMARLRLRERLNKLNYLEYLFLAQKYNCDDELPLAINYVLQETANAKKEWRNKYGTDMPRAWYECTSDDNDVKIAIADKLEEPPSTLDADFTEMKTKMTDADMKIKFVDPSRREKTYSCHQVVVQNESAYFNALMSFNRKQTALASPDAMDI
jgi:hypothetical protein